MSDADPSPGSPPTAPRKRWLKALVIMIAVMLIAPVVARFY